MSYTEWRLGNAIFERYKYFGLQNYSQFILLENDNKIIGYAKFVKNREYFALNHLYLPNRLKEELIALFIRHIINNRNGRNWHVFLVGCCDTLTNSERSNNMQAVSRTNRHCDNCGHS